MYLFCDDDAGYLAWLQANVDGYVLNAERQPKASNQILHTSKCPTINGSPAHGEKWTELYVKVCSLDDSELLNWAKKETGVTELRRCKTCKPKPMG